VSKAKKGERGQIDAKHARRVAGVYLSSTLDVPREAWQPLAERFAKIRDLVWETYRDTRRRSLREAVTELGRLEHAVWTLYAKPSADVERSSALAELNKPKRAPGPLRRVLAAAFDGWSGNYAQLRDRLDMNPDPWDLPRGVRSIESTANGLRITLSNGNRHSPSWGTVEKVARDFRKRR
jgi:hypothetical protein